MSSNGEDFDMSTDGTRRRIARSFCSAIVSAALVPLVGITSVAACSPEQEAQAHVGVVGREPGYSEEVATVCAAEATTICALQAPRSGSVAAAPSNPH